MTTVSSTAAWAGGLPRAVPPGYACIALRTGETGTVRLCIVVRTQRGNPDPGPLVVLREGTDARVLLGCLADVGGRVLEWVELWCQDTGGLSKTPPAYRGALSNRLLDERWDLRSHVIEKFDVSMGAGALVKTGQPGTSEGPMLVDLSAGGPVAPVDSRSGKRWSVCEDEAVLAKHGATPYGTSVTRHLYQADLGDQSPLVPMEAADARQLGIPGSPTIVTLGGRFMVRPLSPLSFDQYVDTLSGSPYEPGNVDGLVKLLAAAAMGGGGGWLGLSGRTVHSRLAEALHLKVTLIGQAVTAVREAVRASQMPFLNISPETFRVRVTEGGGALPRFWTARALLAECGEGVALPLEGTQTTYYLAARGSVSIYQPAHLMRAVSGRGALRLRNVVGEGGAGVILEGTLSTQERLSPGVNDLLWMRCSISGERVDLYGMIDAQAGLASGELRIRTIAQQFAPETLARIRAVLGVPVPDVSFEMVPLLTSACDLYSLGVLAVRTLLVTRKRSLPVALDEVFSLASQAAGLADSGEDLPGRIARVFESDPRWEKSLGAQHLLEDGGTPAEAFAAIPPRLWHGLLASTIRMFTGLTPDSRCRDFGDAPTGGQHRVFDGVLDDLYAHLKSCRSLITGDFGVNSQIRSVVKDCLKSLRA